MIVQHVHRYAEELQAEGLDKVVVPPVGGDEKMKSQGQWRHGDFAGVRAARHVHIAPRSVR